MAAFGLCSRASDDRKVPKQAHATPTDAPAVAIINAARPSIFVLLYSINNRQTYPQPYRLIDGPDALERICE
jgi:hypothetical protein